MESAAREAMVQGALLALLFQFNGNNSVKADRVTCTLGLDDICGTYCDVTYWAGDVPIGGEGF